MVKKKKTTLSLTTLGKQHSATECRVFKLEVFDLDEHNFVELPTVFSTPKLPVGKYSIPQQEDVSKYPHLRGIQLPKIDACIGLLIRNDVPKALQPKEIRECKDQGPYAVRTIFGWTINGPLERKEILLPLRTSSEPTTNSLNSLQSSATCCSVTKPMIKTQKCQRRTYMQ